MYEAWHEKTSVKKGNIGEEYCDDYLISHGVTPYLPSEKWGKAHPFDRLCALGKKELFIAEYKTKEARIYYPDTGFNQTNFNDYLRVKSKYDVPIWLFFVDKNAMQMYGQSLDYLEKYQLFDPLKTQARITKNGINYQVWNPEKLYQKNIKYPLLQNGIRYYPLEAMIKYADLTENQMERIHNFTAVNSAYITQQTAAA